MTQPGGRGNLVHLFQVQTKIYDVTCGLSTQLCPHSQTVVLHISDLRALQEGESPISVNKTSVSHTQIYGRNSF